MSGQKGLKLENQKLVAVPFGSESHTSHTLTFSRLTPSHGLQGTRGYKKEHPRSMMSQPDAVTSWNEGALFCNRGSLEAHEKV